MSWYLNKVATLLSTRNNQFRIYLKNTQTAAYNLPTQDWAVLISGATQVFNDTAIVPAAIGWVPFVFDQPFYYTGGSLEVMVEFDQTQGSGSGGSSLDFDWAVRTVT